MFHMKTEFTNEQGTRSPRLGPGGIRRSLSPNPHGRSRSPNPSMGKPEPHNPNDSSVIPTPDHTISHARGVRLGGVANCRDFGGLPIAGTNKVIKEKMLYRMAAPTYATEEDKCLLLDRLDIVTLIDFRTTYETKNLNFGRRKFEDNFMGFSVRKDNGHEIDSIDRSKEALLMENEADFSALKRLYRGTPRVGTRRHSSGGVVRKRYNIPLINDVYFMSGVYPTAPASTKLKCDAVRSLLHSDKVATYFLLRHLNDLGLFEMYRLTIEHTKREILTIFNILKRFDNYPLGFFCSLGKDRTGIISALIMSLLGVSRETILNDFHETEVHLAPSMPEISAYFQRIGLSNPEFIQAPIPIMKRLLEYIDAVYGSVPKYLNSIGFSYAEQQHFIDFMTVEKLCGIVGE